MTVLRCGQAGLGAAALIALHASGSALAAPLSTGSDSIKILFSGGVDPATGLLKGSPALTATFPDLQAGTFIMDTGSAGMVVYKAGFSPPAGASPAYKDVIQAYKSDNLLFEGDVYTTQIEIGTPGDSVTSMVPILYATKQRCADESKTCSKKDSLRFMGVGFGANHRGEKQTGRSAPLSVIRCSISPRSMANRLIPAWAGSWVATGSPWASPPPTSWASIRRASRP
jgi:hypothetical protein